MKSTILFLLGIVITFGSFAQVPQKFNYQAVVRNNTGVIVANQNIAVKAEILDSNSTTVLYGETHAVTTNAQGLFSLQVGGGAVKSGVFASIDWSAGNRYIRTYVDLTGGTNFQLMGTSQLLSVPYAMYSKNLPITRVGTSDSIYFGDKLLLIPGVKVLNTIPDITTGLVAYYPFNGNAGDSSGNGNHGIATGISLTSDRFGLSNRAYFFNGVNSFPLPPDPVQQVLIQNKIIPLSSNYSVSAWFSSSDVTKFQQCIINSTPHTGFAVELNNENVRGRLMSGVGPANAFWTRIYIPGTTTNFQNNQWYHLTFVKSGTTYTVYLNGQVESSTIVPQASSYTESVGLVIGAIGDGFEVFKGKIDDVRIYKRAITQNQINYLATH